MVSLSWFELLENLSIKYLSKYKTVNLSVTVWYFALIPYYWLDLEWKFCSVNEDSCQGGVKAHFQVKIPNKNYRDEKYYIK